MSEVVQEVRDHVLIVTINRPDARNAVNQAVAEQVAAAIDRLDAASEVRVGVLTGAGGTFCAGMDLKGFLEGEMPTVQGRGFGGLTESPPAKPLIAAVEGWALAGGFELVLACDLVVASRAAMFGIPEVKRGLVAAAGGLLRLPQRLPYHIAMQLALTGDPLTAEDAHRFGLVNVLSKPGESLEAALQLAAAVSANAPLALRASKAVVQHSLNWAEDEGWSKQAAIVDPVFSSNDAHEGASAFAEKRVPRWSGS